MDLVKLLSGFYSSLFFRARVISIHVFFLFNFRLEYQRSLASCRLRRLGKILQPKLRVKFTLIHRSKQLGWQTKSGSIVIATSKLMSILTSDYLKYYSKFLVTF